MNATADKTVERQKRATSPLQTRLAQEDLETLESFITLALDARLAQLKKSSALPSFKRDDVAFLIWTCGFAAGAHMDRDGEKGERIFLRCRQMIDELEQQLPAGNSS